jgi:hypothetical protein
MRAAHSTLPTTALALLLAALAVLTGASCAAAAELHVGAASVSITPNQPVTLAGQFHVRISRHIDSPCTANVLVLESRDGNTTLDQAILVSCDVAGVPGNVAEKIRQRLPDRAPGIDGAKVFLSATHTHTAPVLQEGVYHIPETEIDVMTPAQYIELFVDRVTDAIVEAWQGRKAGAVSWGLGHAVVAYNRRAVYADGTAAMYGDTHQPTFREIENGEDHGLEVLFFWDADKKLVATAVNVACPSQEVENNSNLSADFWHPVREQLRQKYGDKLVVLGWTGGAGDQSPHPIFRKAAEERMRRLSGQHRLDVLAGRIVRGWEEAYAGAAMDIQTDLPLVHKVQTLKLASRVVTPEEYLACKATVERLSPDPRQQMEMVWNRWVVERFERQQNGSAAPYEMELHAIRLGDVAIATNEFELFTQYGIQMKARSPAIQTFVIQLGAGTSSYLPTATAARGGGYSAIVQSSIVSPEGGQQLVEETVAVIQSLWPTGK